MVEKKLFGKLAGGEEVYEYKLKNSAGAEVKIINYGATVVSLMMPDRNGKIEDVVLGYDSLEGYVNDKSYFGSIVGRYGNRIDKGKFKLDGKEYHLTLNDGENHLHGGTLGFNKALWNVDSATSSDNGSSITMSYLSKDGEEGYPGNVKLTVVYELNNDNELSINYTGTTDKPTILNPTHHSYFNLTGDPNNTILDHELMIDSDNITPVKKGLIPTGKFSTVENTPMDFSRGVRIGEFINADYAQIKLGFGYDHNWVLNKHQGLQSKVATVYEPKSGRVLEVFTDQPGMQFYSGNFLDGTVKGKNGVVYKHRTGFCLEAQNYPDSPNHSNFPSARLEPGQTYRQTTVYRFAVK
ncbi:MAG: galactose-1-epimerase [Ignavibacteriae bacterium HGW-Ignavibacteriae-3]|nr:MAG: galactose-1-epimerase [Ignavibacteriae bacterium HGW-Ignavibacteriae-3]